MCARASAVNSVCAEKTSLYGRRLYVCFYTRRLRGEVCMHQALMSRALRTKRRMAFVALHKGTFLSPRLLIASCEKAPVAHPRVLSFLRTYVQYIRTYIGEKEESGKRLHHSRERKRKEVASLARKETERGCITREKGNGKRLHHSRERKVHYADVMLKRWNSIRLLHLATIRKGKYFSPKNMEMQNEKREEEEKYQEEGTEKQNEKMKQVTKRMNEILSIAAECIQEEELKEKLLTNQTLLCYDGFEPSVEPSELQLRLTPQVLLNNKMSGDIKKIQKVGKYFVEVWKSCGMNMENVKFLWASEQINSRPNDYWSLVIDIAKSFNVTRIKRCLKIMGRSEGEDNYCSQILYPCMQCADIFFLNVDICQLGIDQRKVNMLAREYCDIKKRKKKPIILSHEMLPGLLEGQEKMSKSDENSSIFMDDSEADVNRKIKKGFCPPNVIQGNPIFAYAKSIIFPRYQEFRLVRKEKNGGKLASQRRGCAHRRGNRVTPDCGIFCPCTSLPAPRSAGTKTYQTMEELEADYVSGAVHPLDLKDNVATYINEMLNPVREHFQKNAEAKNLLNEIKKYKITK
ncbi:tyrosine--tRNA ligase (TyrRS) [Plasmodium ovale wallikeri]|uniref:tyrosine--tRNA ligase n=1 Tax=Plasmodium ovale wallikeri TaxID=864142 RepID=A0A1A8YHA3_PLAOA|nr:tyrosine--tRNA ligase (TyrRS) [Plasmodium ovale wallikeri]